MFIAVCCPNHFERSLKHVCPSILAKWNIGALNLFESRAQAGRVFKAPATSFRLIKKVLDKAKGYYGARSRVYRVAHQAVIKAGQYAYRDRRVKKRMFRSLWIARINAAAREHGLSYSRFIDGLHKAGIEIDRKILAELAIFNKDAFAVLAQQSKASLA